MSVVIDASVALKWVLDEPDHEAADALLDEELVAPTLWLVEAANALWRRARRGEFNETHAADLLTELTHAPVAPVPIEDDILAAATLAHSLAHPVYDCLYLALAIRVGTFVVTANRRFHSIARRVPGVAAAVRLLGAA